MTDPKRRNLGRGLAALLGDENEDGEYSSLDRLRTAKQVPIEQIHPNKQQPRRYFDEEALAALAQSVAQNGLLQPILVRRHPDIPREYEIVAGERRWRAAQRAQLHEVPIVLRELDDRAALELAIVENVQRQDLNPLEEAQGYHRLIEDFAHSQDDVARVVGKSRSHVANMIRLLQLPDSVKTLLENGTLSAGHARALLNAENPYALALQVVERGLSVRATEKLAQEVKAAERGETLDAEVAKRRTAKPGGSGPRSQEEKDADTRALEDDLSALLGLRVNISVRGESGTLAIHYKTLEQLDDLLSRLNQPGEVLRR